jgi:hypothetical protein
MRGPGRVEQEPAVTATEDRGALRCHCGSLLARLVPQGVEIKCRRCKRRVVIRLNNGAFKELELGDFGD